MNNFFGSKFNTVLLVVLIILVTVVLKIMLLNKDIYLPFFSEKNTDTENAEKAPEILGNKADLVFFSIKPGAKVKGLTAYQGSIKGAYFFEANIVINILDENKKVLKASHANATSDWMTTEPVEFEGKIDLTGLPKGFAYFEIHNDNASGLPEYDKSVLIPLVIE